MPKGVYKKTKAHIEKTNKNLKPHPENMIHDYWKGKKRKSMIGNQFAKGKEPWNKGLRKYKDLSSKEVVKMWNVARQYDMTLDEYRKFIKNGCELCGWKLTIDIHHKTPRKQGGNNNRENLIALCPNCHSVAHRLKLSIEKIKKLYE